MLLSSLLKGIQHSKIKEDFNISSVVSSSDNVVENCLFVCIKGENFDSHSIASSVISKGAVCVITQVDLDIKEQIIVPDTKKALSVIWSNFYLSAEKKLKLIAVTGTNGKTSTAYMIRHILESNNHKTGFIGTVGYSVEKDDFLPSDLTTPEPEELYYIFNKMVLGGCEYCVMEASSQALSQQRCFGLDFAGGVFTNITTDHMDYHKTFENYLLCKAMLFRQCEVSVLNLDDPQGRFLSSFAKDKVTFFSRDNNEADYFTEKISFSENGCVFLIKGIEFFVPVAGKFTLNNSLGAISVCNALGLSLEKCAAALKTLPPVPGRLELIKTDTAYKVFVDYAHTPDAIVNVLQSVRIFAKGRVVALFGCGGDRDKTKRPLMAKAAAENADYIIITTDNPRTENPNEIIEDILPGIKGTATPCAIIPDRTHAIEYALKNAKDDDTIILCGKGHETYQIIGKEKTYYDEREIVKSFLKIR